MEKHNFKKEFFPDGSICLTCGEGMERDLVFASGAMSGDPDLIEQEKIVDFILLAISQYREKEIDLVPCIQIRDNY